MLYAEDGVTDVYSPGPKRVLQWKITWNGLNVFLNTNGPTREVVAKFKAEILNGAQKGTVATSDEGSGSKDGKELNLHGHVQLTSKSKKATLKCDNLKYIAATHRFYATGNVRFSNPVGSVGTFSELIATSDKNGDIDSVTTPQAAEADLHTFTSSDGQTVVSSKGLRWVKLGPSKSRFLFTQGVLAKLSKSGFNLQADQATAYADSSDPRSQLSPISASGHVRLVNTTLSKPGGEKSVLECNQLDYLERIDGATAKCQGSVVLTQFNEQKKQTLRATGGRGQADFSASNPSSSKGDTLTLATLFSPVTLDFSRIATEPGKGSKTHLTCSRLDYRPKPSSRELVLHGNVHMNGEGMSGVVGKATLELDPQGQAKELRVGDQ